MKFKFPVYLFLTLCGAFSFEHYSQTLPDFNRKQTYDVIHYKIASSFDRAKREITGDTTITLRPLADNFQIAEFDAAGLSFKRVSIEPSTTELKFRTLGEKVIVSFDKAYSSVDMLSIRLTYTAKPKKGVYFNEPLVEDGVEQRSAQIYTQGEPDEHRHWFPSFDFPSDKATSEQIITAEKDFTVIANGELLSRLDNTNGTTTWHYKMPIPHSSYLISFIVGKYVKVEEKYKEIPLGYYVYPGREDIVKNAYRTTADMMRIFEELTGIPYPYNKYDQTIVGAFNFGGMENITATTMADSEIFYANISFLQGNVEDLVSHELAHSWFGNLVTCKNWAELWLNEGFATFMEAAYRERKYGRDDYMRKVTADAEDFIAFDATHPRAHGLFNRTANNVAALFDSAQVTYDKGGAVIHTLREQIGEVAFWKAINLYLARHKFGNVETTDLRKVMEESSGQDLDWFFDQWVYGTGYPKLSIAQRWNPRTKTLSVTVTQTQRSGVLNTTAFRLPLEFEFLVAKAVIETKNIEITKRTETFNVKLSKKPTSIVIDKAIRVPIKVIKVVPLR